MPTSNRLIEGYARGLFAVADAERSLEEVEDQLYRFGKAVEAEPKLREALTDPKLPPDRKRDVLRELLGKKASPHTVNLLGFLVEQGRSKDLGRIIAAVIRVAAERRRHAVGEVRTAVPLDAGQRDRLTKALAEATGKELELKVLVDPSVIGGVVARVDDQVFDGTVRRKLEVARQRLGRVR